MRRQSVDSAAGRRACARGFTMIEIMVVVTIIAIMLVVGVPAMSEFVADQRVRTVASDIVGEIALARAKAIESSRRVYMEKLGANWNNGWRLYVDMNDNGQMAPYDAGIDLELKKFDGFTAGTIYICTVPPGLGKISFRPDGRIVYNGIVTPGLDGIYIVDRMGDGDAANDKIRGVQYGLSGRATVRKMNGTAFPCTAN